jgi:hypothetical protein
MAVVEYDSLNQPWKGSSVAKTIPSMEHAEIRQKLSRLKGRDLIKLAGALGVKVVPCHALVDKTLWCDYNPLIKKVSRGGFMGHTCSIRNGEIHVYRRYEDKDKVIQ